MDARMRAGSLSRRALLGLGMGGAAAVSLVGCDRFGGGGGGVEDAAGRLNVIWWGDVNRANATEAMLDLYREASPDVTVTTDYADSGPYQDRMATRFAAGDAPDLMNQRADAISEYAERGSLLDLSGHLDVLDLGDVSDRYPTAEVDGGLYGIPAGLNAIGFVVNRDTTERYGVEVPDDKTWSWEEFWDFSQTITRAAEQDGEETYGVHLDFGLNMNAIVWIRQAGEHLYTEDGQFGASEEVLSEWFEMAVRQREAGGIPPAGFLEVSGGSPEESPIARGLVAAQAIPTNNYAAYNEASGGSLQLCRFPGEVQGQSRGMSIDTPMFWSVAADSDNVEGALDLLNFMVNDVEANEEVGATRGLPVSEAVAEELTETFSPEDQRSVEYILELAEEELPEYRLGPAGGSVMEDIIAEMGEEVEFGCVTPEQAAQRIRAEAEGEMGVA